MRHLKKGRKFGRLRNQRRSLLRILLGQFAMRERIVTSEAKAKEIAPLMEKAITTAKSGNLAARRALARRLPEAAAEKLVKVIAPRLSARHGGYTRLTKLGARKSDSSRRALIELVK